MDFLFPDDFLFGAASSACQIESAVHEGGKGEDVADHFYKLFPEKYLGGDPDKSADFYHKYPEDVKLMKELGLRCFRFSISWSRIYPNGPDEVSRDGLDYYSRLIDCLKSEGIKTFFDLFHCDLPYWVVERGGILEPDFVQWFKKYARTCFEEFGDRVEFWSTVNEPSINVYGAYANACNAPFLKDDDLAVKASHNMILAHYEAVRTYKSLGLKGKIGAVIHFEPVYSLSMDPLDDRAARMKQAFYSGLWLDPMLKGRYPEILLKEDWFFSKLPENHEKDLKDSFVANDFIAVNYYSPSFAEYAPEKRLRYRSVVNNDLPKDAYGFFSYPQGLYDALKYLSETYPGKDIFISENGIGVEKSGDYEKDLDDSYRIAYLREHLRSVSRAISAGFPVKGYFHWTFLDTNELYAGGYKYIFGLVQVRYDTLERVPRKSFEFYKKVIKEGRVD
ncbi:MAG: family 1 glycosylhydrolase [Clostridia bacterium]|nr:family 1 glycosylhydrolase [Clostridia bacterium]